MKLSSVINGCSFVSSLLRAKLLGQHTPLMVILKITNKCNTACSYCIGKYYERYEKEKHRELTNEQWFSIIDELAASGTRRITILGGEPLLREDIGEIIDYIKYKEIDCGLGTNGLLVPEKIKDISKLNTITISLDGDKDAHDANRGKGTFEKVMEAIKVVKSYEIPLHVNTTITKNNINSIDYVMELAKKTGFFIQIKPFYRRVLGDIDNRFPEQLSRQEFTETVSRILSYKKKGYPVFFSHRNYENMINWPDLTKDRITDREPEFDHNACYAGRYFCIIDANGDVSPCTPLIELKVRNCLGAGFMKAFNYISQHNCRACRWVCYNEYNLLFNLDIGAILNMARNTLAR